MSAHSKLAHEAAASAGDAARDGASEKATAHGLAAVAFALLDVADAIREASKPVEKANPLNTSRDW
jgi:hypothetical protein